MLTARGGAVDSAGQAESLLRDGAECCLLLAAMSVETERVIAEIDVVRDFAEVFPDEVPGLPPVREMEFSIELVPGAGPVSVAPYRMTPAELVELKGQLEDLLEKQLVRPSVSLWGAPVLLVKKKEGGSRVLFLSIYNMFKIQKREIEEGVVVNPTDQVLMANHLL
uniref:Transposon Ty3-I Gag-Pol polyprotein n=1 Tax=Cajanus cajan TaxID=3821 RepID=A0A151RUK7_CAJCA|nr:hypothetical protein KK1_032213 [Cajanus cajan]